MAGIGFDILKLWKKGTYQSLARAYGLTMFMGSGPSIFIILGIGIILALMFLAEPDSIAPQRQFLTFSVYLYSSSMIVSSFFQYTFFRFMADRILTKDFDQILPNFIGVLFIQLVISAAFSIPVVFYLFSAYNLLLQVTLISTFILLTFIWLSVVFLTGIKTYRKIIIAFAVGYGGLVVANLLLRQNSIDSLLMQLLFAQAIIFLFLLHAIIDYYPSSQLIKFDCLKKGNFYYGLFFANFFYTLGLWADKYIFWFSKDTGHQIFPGLFISPIYDTPIFMAYLTIIPATAVFLMRIEAKFSLIYPKYMEFIFERKTLGEINAIRDELVIAGRDAIYNVMKTQGIVVIIMFLLSLTIINWLHLPTIIINLMLILFVAVGMNVILWSLLTILYYMTRYTQALIVTFIFVITNILFTLYSIYLGPAFYGYGFSISLLISIASALILLNREFKYLEYTTFMLVD